ncbi:hypothetical protein C8F04DRAFT_1265709 [Mycena alexandri]|uniref:CxC2-like cysteine cluster KDZ transposase-associated domain-containing protein n=1 Tax=Mycena alexandri TaxID=1745969 RepID=A0AAD6SJK1_9AGAR|nr:hypothetical protein C8F04DRAFT_1265709 [Mycena alexandri]
MPANSGPNWENNEILEMYMGIENMLALRSWAVRGRSVCTCGQPAYVVCNDCGPPDLCEKCIVVAHRTEPFHNVQAWSDALNYYTHTTFYHLGFCVELGHGEGACPAPRYERREIITLSGLKTLGVNFCACPKAQSKDDQIKAHGWWPMRSNFICALPLLLLPAASRAEGSHGSESESEGASSEGDESGGSDSGSGGATDNDNEGSTSD